MPLFFQRVYTSDRKEDSGLGAGWSFIFDDRITVEGDAAVLKTGSGGTIAFRREGGGRSFKLAAASPSPHQSFEVTEGDTITERAAGLTRTYASVGGVYRLTRIADGYGNSIDIGFDARGNLARVASGADAQVVGRGRRAPALRRRHHRPARRLRA